jgi:hypothetical protein
MDILGVPLAQFEATNNMAMTPDYSSISSGMDTFKGTDVFKPADFVLPKTSTVPDDISTITSPS